MKSVQNHVSDLKYCSEKANVHKKISILQEVKDIFRGTTRVMPNSIFFYATCMLCKGHTLYSSLYSILMRFQRLFSEGYSLVFIYSFSPDSVLSHSEQKHMLETSVTNFETSVSYFYSSLNTNTTSLLKMTVSGLFHLKLRGTPYPAIALFYDRLVPNMSKILLSYDG